MGGVSGLPLEEGISIPFSRPQRGVGGGSSSLALLLILPGNVACITLGLSISLIKFRAAWLNLKKCNPFRNFQIFKKLPRVL